MPFSSISYQRDGLIIVYDKEFIHFFKSYVFPLNANQEDFRVNN